ncbi:hypothetical protein LWI29_034494 [Acer saccharum]|uniref:Uncharacterized protein n=1 Tax=Acer saccharum TaxID=4024 RepID=A0AA39RYB3_ACESA|nr:hypothetical protein LWI29_034494 [Acer saccharum]KAK1563605.1 hypothetical protein Q3G72_029885 [Acer saccharum]
MVTPSQITKSSMEAAMEMSSGNMRWTATVWNDGDEQHEEILELIEEKDMGLFWIRSGFNFSVLTLKY